MSLAFPLPAINGRPDIALQDAMKTLSPQQIETARGSATEFEAVFLNSMFQQMVSGLNGDGPFGNTPGTGVWRSMLTDEHARSLARSGGVGIAGDVFRTLIMQQAARGNSGVER